MSEKKDTANIWTRPLWLIKKWSGNKENVLSKALAISTLQAKSTSAYI